MSATHVKRASAKVTLYYQTVTAHYIKAPRDTNQTDHWGETLYKLWLRTDKGAPVEMATTFVRLQ